jgi:hypothetical protein
MGLWPEAFSWPLAVAVQAPITLALILWEMTRPRYHGLGCRWLNPRHFRGNLTSEEGPPGTPL